MIKTIFFDIGGVLLNIYPKRTIKHISDITGLTVDEIGDAFPLDAHHRYEKGEISDLDFYSAVVGNLPENVELSKKDFWYAWDILVGEQTPIVNIMNTLAEKYSVWLLSNTNPYHVRNKILGPIIDKISGTLYSCDLGCRKPDTIIYKKALEIAGVKAEESIFIDDLIDNIKAASLLNFNTILFRSEATLITDLKQFNLI